MYESPESLFEIQDSKYEIRDLKIRYSISELTNQIMFLPISYLQKRMYFSVSSSIITCVNDIHK